MCPAYATRLSRTELVSLVSVTQRYAHLSTAALQDAANTASVAIRGNAAATVEATPNGSSVAKSEVPAAT